jgi:hypothetical protein
MLCLSIYSRFVPEAEKAELGRPCPKAEAVTPRAMVPSSRLEHFLLPLLTGMSFKALVHPWGKRAPREAAAQASRP